MKRVIVCSGIMGLSLGGICLADPPGGEPVPSVEVTVQGEREQPGGFVERKDRQTDTESTVTQHTIEVSGTPGQSSLLKAFDLIPGLHVETPDPYGLQSHTPANFRIRGQEGIGLGLTVEGVPVWAIESPGGRWDMFDLENFDSITLYKGAVPLDKGLGAGDTSGSIDAHYLRPSNDFGVTAKESSGAFLFNRPYLRIDSGLLNSSGTKFYTAYSYTHADKWRGLGDTDDRQHAAFGIEQPFTSNVKAEAYIDFNSQRMDNYRTLTYAQTQNLNQYRTYDYNNSVIGVAAQDINYYAFNGELDTDLNALMKIEYKADQWNTFTLKPYYFSEYRPHWTGSTSLPLATGNGPGVRYRTNDFDREGLIGEYAGTLAKNAQSQTNLLVGMWWELYDFPIGEKEFSLVNGAPVFSRWLLARPDTKSTIYSPYLKLSNDWGKLHSNAGVRYLYEDDSAVTGFLSNGIPNVSLNQALAMNPLVDPASSYGRQVQHEWLPNAGVSYDLTKETALYAEYGRNYFRGRGYPELQNTFALNRAAFLAAGETLQSIVNKLKMETSNNYDIGARMNFNRAYIAPTLFYATYDHALVTVYDPIPATAYPINVGQERSYGGEIEIGTKPLDHLDTFTSFTYAISQITNNFQVSATSFANVSGHETPDASRFSAKTGVRYQIDDWDVTPVFKYLGSRFGEVTDSEKIPAYIVVDFNLTYRVKPSLLQALFGTKGKEGFIGMSVLNAFNKNYISLINSFDDTRSGATSYQVGAPRTVAMMMGVKF